MSDTWVPPGGTTDQQDAFATLQAILTQYGLGDLAQWAWGELVSGAGASQIMLDLYNQDAFKQRFQAIFARQDAGLPAMSPAEVIAYETQARQMMVAAGLPAGFYDTPDDFVSFMAKDISVAELQQRVNLGVQAAFQSPPEVLAELKNLYGIDPGSVAAFFLDPGRAEPIIQQQFQSAQIAGAALQQGFGQLTADQAQALAVKGLTFEQAQASFGMLGVLSGALGAGLGSGEAAVGTDVQLAAVGGDAAAAAKIGARTAARAGANLAGGSYATGKEGISGLGSAAK